MHYGLDTCCVGDVEIVNKVTSGRGCNQNGNHRRKTLLSSGILYYNISIKAMSLWCVLNYR
jgi:hypothetical protein